MLISNGKMTRNIADKRLPEYMAKGYKEVKIEPIKKEVKEPAKGKAPKK